MLYSVYVYDEIYKVKWRGFRARFVLLPIETIMQTSQIEKLQKQTVGTSNEPEDW